ncbi:MAG: DUF4838 domain-containing protein [Candidatus Zipacnadales bacterium]
MANCVSLVPALLVVCGTLAEAVTIVQDDQPRAVIVLDEAESQQVREACLELQSCIKESTGAWLESVSQADQGIATIRIGRSGAAFITPPPNLDDDEFIIDFPDAETIVIIGGSDWGVEFGVYEFLERYIGVRWLMPGPNGRDVPQHSTIDVPPHLVRQAPAFFSRLFSGLRGEAHTTWARRNRMHGRVSFHHNLLHLFPPETYTKTHPEFFPLQNGERYLPPTNDTHHWQPCFTAPGIVEEAIKNIVAYFDQNPDAESYSLGVNDSSGHCECPTCRACDPGVMNFLGYQHLSDRYFAWANAVVEGVTKVHPGKIFGCLAYSEIGQPPDRVKVSPSIIPYMTYDRMKWIDPTLRAEGEAMTRAWHAKCPVLGWYDYIYGTPYCLPRVWFHHMADYYRFGHANGVRALYAEAYPNFGEGPKLYLSLKLQWDPQQDVDALLDEWYIRCVGPKAAPHLKAYYAFWEDFWTRRILDSPWFTRGGQYLRFFTAEYLADVTPAEISECRRLLEAAGANTQTDKQRARAELLLKAFEYYETSALTYPRLEENTQPLDSEQAALEALERAARCADLVAKRQQLVAEIGKDPVLVHPLSMEQYPSLRGDTWGTVSLWRIFDWLGRSAAVTARVRALAEDTSRPRVREQALTMLNIAEGAGKNLALDPSFEEGDRWSLWVKFETGSMKYSEDQAHTGARSMLCEGMARGGPHQTLPFEPGRYAAVCFVRVPDGQTSKGTVELAITPRDAEHNNLSSLSTTIIPVPSQWIPLMTGGTIPAEVNGKAVAELLLVAIVNGFAPKERVYIDDMTLYRFDE